MTDLALLAAQLLRDAARRPAPAQPKPDAAGQRGQVNARSNATS